MFNRSCLRRVVMVLAWLATTGGLASVNALAQQPAVPPAAAPADALRALQGEWRVATVYLPIQEGAGKFPPEVAFATEGAEIRIESNQLFFDGKLAATLANDLDLKPQAEQVGMRDYRLMLVTLPSGKGLLCSYRQFGTGMELTYTHRCSCHRGSGHILAFQRIDGDESPSRRPTAGPESNPNQTTGKR